MKGRINDKIEINRIPSLMQMSSAKCLIHHRYIEGEL